MSTKTRTEESIPYYSILFLWDINKIKAFETDWNVRSCLSSLDDCQVLPDSEILKNLHYQISSCSATDFKMGTDIVNYLKANHNIFCLHTQKRREEEDNKIFDVFMRGTLTWIPLVLIHKIEQDNYPFGLIIVALPDVTKQELTNLLLNPDEDLRVLAKVLWSE